MKQNDKKKLHNHILSLSCTPTSHLSPPPISIRSQYRAKHKIDNFYHHGAVTYCAFVMNLV